MLSPAQNLRLMIKVKGLMLTANKKSSHLTLPIFNSERPLLNFVFWQNFQMNKTKWQAKIIGNMYLTTDSPGAGKN